MYNEKAIAFLCTKYYNFSVMNKKATYILLSFGTILSLFSCGRKMTAKIIFELDGGYFPGNDFDTGYLEGESGTPVLVDIVDPVKDGYYFVGWREKTKAGAYREINKRIADDGKEYYYYPYVNDVFYAYFEPLSTITFDLTDAKDRNGVLVAPKLDSSSFQVDKLNGYASKSILSLDYLPTATADGGHLTFDYWYTEYPLESVEDENGIKHYRLNTDGDKGIYQFDRSFGTDNMSFPISDDNNITLYAKWTEDPKITIHYNIEGIEDSVFQGKDEISSELVQILKENLGIDLSINDDIYYPSDTKKKRFNGFYTDADLKSRFNLTSTISTNDLELYLGWDDLVTVTFDYNGGTVDGKSQDVITDTYYQGDVLSEEILESHTPTYDGKYFYGYQVDGVEYRFGKDKIAGDITLVAKYTEDPALTLKIDYPANYTGDKVSDFTAKVAPGTDLATYLEIMKNTVADTTLAFKYCYTIKDDKEIELDYNSMLDTDCEIYLKYDYLPVVQIDTYWNETGTYELCESHKIDDIYYGNDGVAFTENKVDNGSSSFVDGGSTYLFNGYYDDSALTNKTVFPFYETTAHTNRNVRKLYRKMTKGIKLTFKEYSDGAEIGELVVLPNSSAASYTSELSALLGSYNSLIVKSDGKEQVLLDFADVDLIIYVKR